MIKNLARPGAPKLVDGSEPHSYDDPRDNPHFSTFPQRFGCMALCTLVRKDWAEVQAHQLKVVKPTSRLALPVAVEGQRDDAVGVHAAPIR